MEKPGLVSIFDTESIPKSGNKERTARRRFSHRPIGLGRAKLLALGMPNAVGYYVFVLPSSDCLVSKLMAQRCYVYESDVVKIDCPAWRETTPMSSLYRRRLQKGDTNARCLACYSRSVTCKAAVMLLASEFVEGSPREGWMTWVYVGA